MWYLVLVIAAVAAIGAALFWRRRSQQWAERAEREQKEHFETLARAYLERGRAGKRERN